MPASFLRIFPALLALLAISACASGPGMAPEIKSIPTPEVSAVDSMMRRIKQNDGDIVKYYSLDDEGRIFVKAETDGDAGSFEITYDLEGARPLGEAAYEVRFSAKNKETGDTLEDTLIWRPAASGAGILLSFDDDYFESWERHFDLFDRYQAKVTFFLQGAFHPFAARAMGRGHDIGYHGLNHLDLRGISRTAFNRETASAIESFRQSGVLLASFAYPYGYFEPWMHNELLKDYALIRGYGVTFRLYTEEQIRSGFISSRGIDNTVIPGDADFERLIVSMFRTVQFLDGGLVLPLTSHDVSEAAWAISARRLEFLLETAAGLGLRFYRYSDFSPR